MVRVCEGGGAQVVRGERGAIDAIYIRLYTNVFVYKRIHTFVCIYTFIHKCETGAIDAIYTRLYTNVCIHTYLHKYKLCGGYD